MIGWWTEGHSDPDPLLQFLSILGLRSHPFSGQKQHQYHSELICFLLTQENSLVYERARGSHSRLRAKITNFLPRNLRKTFFHYHSKSLSKIDRLKPQYLLHAWPDMQFTSFHPDLFPNNMHNTLYFKFGLVPPVFLGYCRKQGVRASLKGLKFLFLNFLKFVTNVICWS